MEAARPSAREHRASSPTTDGRARWRRLPPGLPLAPMRHGSLAIEGQDGSGRRRSSSLTGAPGARPQEFAGSLRGGRAARLRRDRARRAAHARRAGCRRPRRARRGPLDRQAHPRGDPGAPRHRHAPALEEVLDLTPADRRRPRAQGETSYVRAGDGRRHRASGPDQFVVTSFHPAVLAQVKDCAAHARTGLLISPNRQIARCPSARHWGVLAAFLAPPPARLVLAAGLFGWAERQRLAIWVWTVNEQRVLRALGNDPRVAAVITDRPSRALDVYKPLTRLTAGSRLSTSWEREPPGA